MPRHVTTRTATRGSRRVWKRKNVVVDQRKLDRARSLLGAPTETAAIDTALDLVVFRGEVLAGLEKLRAAGGLADVFEE